jgi:type IV pilus assembly protein PilA
VRFIFSMKMESEVWRLHEVDATIRFPLDDPAFLKIVEEQQLRQNEQTALGSVRTINTAEESYQSAQGGFACTLSALGSAGKTPGVAKRTYLYDSQLASGRKNGYAFALSGCDTSHYQVVAKPELPDSGERAYCSDESGVVRSSSDGKASTCQVSGEVVEEKVPAANVRFSAPAQGNATSGTSQPEQRVRIAQGVSAGLLQSATNLSASGATGEDSRDSSVEGNHQSDGRRRKPRTRFGSSNAGTCRRRCGETMEIQAVHAERKRGGGGNAGHGELHPE